MICRLSHRVRPPDGCRACRFLRRRCVGELRVAGKHAPLTQVQWCGLEDRIELLRADPTTNRQTRPKQTVAVARRSTAKEDEYLPCGCAAYLPDRSRNTLHHDCCLMKHVSAGKSIFIRQRPAVVAMFAQLNEFWYLSHACGSARDDPKRDGQP